MRIIIAGAGSVGRYMAGQLQAAGHEVTLIDQSARVVARGIATRDPAGGRRRERGEAGRQTPRAFRPTSG